MSLLGFDMTGTATINGLTEINANNVWSDVLYYDAGTVPVNVKTAIDGITVDVTALEADVATLQGEMNAVEADVATLQGEMNAVEADVATLQGEMNAVEADVAALIISTGVTAATVAGLVISQAAQDVTIASHTVSIAALQLEDAALDTRIVTLEQKTSDQSWGALTGTTFATKVNVGGGSGVVLNTAAASEFNSGIVCSSIASTSATTNIDIGSALTTGDVNLGSSAGATGVALNWGGASNSGNLSFQGGSFTLTSSGIYTQRSGPTFDMTIADTQTSGVLNIAGNASRTGAINIGVGTTTAKNITIGTGSGGTTLLRGASATVTIGNSGTLTLSSATGGTVNLGTSMTSGTITIGKNDATASTSTIDINTGSAMTGAINIGSGASAKPITVGSAASTNTINGTTTIAGTANINTTSLSNTSIGNGAAGGNFTVNAAANSITGTTNTLTSTGETEINCVALDINASGATTLDTLTFNLTNTELLATAMTFTTNTNGSDLILSNATTGSFSIGAGTNQDLIVETTGTGILSLEVASANKMVATSSTTTLTNTNLELTGIMTLTGAQTRPIEIGTYASQSSYSTTSTTPITTYLGGTLESTKTFTNSATGNFRYIMASVTPFDANGAITLTAGTYMFWLAINFEDASVFNLTDLTMGLTTVSTLTTASTEATIIASLPNLTCFFHKTDAGDASATDSEQRVLSSCFRLGSSTTVYPFYSANHSVTVDSVSCNTVFVKIGGP
jgi:hypothetical protein